MKLASLVAFKLLNGYLWIRYRLSFYKIEIDTTEIELKIDSGLPVLFIANHASWWDGFFVYEVFKKLKIEKEFRIVMLESELKKFPFFRLCGAVGLIPKNLKHNNEVFDQLKGHCVAFFPQGQMVPQNQRPLILKNGITGLIQRLHPLQIILVTLHIEPFQFMKPTVLIKAGSLIKSCNEKVDSVSLAQLLETQLDDVSLRWTSQLYLKKDDLWK